MLESILYLGFWPKRCSELLIFRESEGPPPNDYRQISVFPRIEELMAEGKFSHIKDHFMTLWKYSLNSATFSFLRLAWSVITVFKFRTATNKISYFPQKCDFLIDDKTYLRANIVKGAYDNVDHYGTVWYI